MKRIKIFFEDFWASFNVHENFITRLLRKEYEVIVDKNPDYLFFSVFGYNHLKYRNCIKIFYTGENSETDFNSCDYAIAFQHLEAGDRYFRYPLYVETGYEKIKYKSFDIQEVLHRKFCNFIYSDANLADPIRALFFKKLSRYKRVDSGGRYLNNIGEPVADKITFIKDYKFTIAFENSALSGYTTEKIVDAMTVNSMPIYWGNPDIHLDFNKESFICVNDFNSLDDAIDEIIRLDSDDDAYIEKLSKPWLIESAKTYAEWQDALLSFLKNIFDQDYSKAQRRTNYGWVRPHKRKQEIMGVLFSNRITRPLIKGLYFMARKF